MKAITDPGRVIDVRPWENDANHCATAMVRTSCTRSSCSLTSRTFVSSPSTAAATGSLRSAGRIASRSPFSPTR